MTELRANLSHWLHRVGDGDEVVVTERGVPVARIIGVACSSTIEALTAQGVIARPARPDRPRVDERERPRSRRPVSDIVSDQRR